MCRSDQRRKKGFLPQRIYGSIMDTGVQEITGFLKKMFNILLLLGVFNPCLNSPFHSTYETYVYLNKVECVEQSNQWINSKCLEPHGT